MSDVYLIDVVFGTVDVECRWLLCGDGSFYGQSRKIVRGRCGGLIEITPWQDTGVRMVIQAYEPTPKWWQFWK